MRITVKLKNRRGMIANFVAKERDLHDAALETIERYGELALTVARTVVPVDTGRMRRSLTLVWSDGKLVFTLMYDPEVFQRDGVTYYPPFVEYGTLRMHARPTLQMTYAQIRMPYQRDLRAAMRRAA